MNKICIVYTHHKLGDLIWQLPYIKAISQHHQTNIDLVVREKTQAQNILKDLKHINQIFYNDFRKGLFYWVDVFKLIKVFKSEKYDFVYILDKVNKPAIAAKIAKIKNIIGPGFKNQKKWLTVKNFLNECQGKSKLVISKFLPPDLKFGFSMWAFAFFLGGLGVAGQPQVVSRVMTLNSDEDRKQAMIWFFVWQTPFIALMFIVGLASRVLFTEGDFDAELGLPALAMDTLPALGVGMILASIFAATMSTADSQVLACTAAITDDIKPEWRENHKTTKIVTLYVAAAATMISIAGLYVPGGDSVFALVAVSYTHLTLPTKRIV